MICLRLHTFTLHYKTRIVGSYGNDKLRLNQCKQKRTTLFLRMSMVNFCIIHNRGDKMRRIKTLRENCENVSNTVLYYILLYSQYIIILYHILLPRIILYDYYYYFYY